MNVEEQFSTFSEANNQSVFVVFTVLMNSSVELIMNLVGMTGLMILSDCFDNSYVGVEL